MSSPLQIIMIDNFDSFTYNLVNQFRLLGAEVIVYRNDAPLEQVFTEQRLANPNSVIVISPGPGNPTNAGNSLRILETYSGRFPILGICLGHQAIVQHFGGVVAQTKQIIHGKADNIFTQPHAIFQGLPNPFRAARYHSLVATHVPESLAVLANTQDEVMAVKHQQHKTLGFQFHPESILTTFGSQLLQNALSWLTDKSLNSIQLNSTNQQQ